MLFIYNRFKKNICSIENKSLFLQSNYRDVAQSGLEYASGGRGVGSSNLLIPTKEKCLHSLEAVNTF